MIMSPIKNKLWSCKAIHVIMKVFHLLSCGNLSWMQIQTLAAYSIVVMRNPNRLRIGHSKFRGPPNTCHHCGETLTVDHMLLECTVSLWDNSRDLHIGISARGWIVLSNMISQIFRAIIIGISSQPMQFWTCAIPHNWAIQSDLLSYS